MYLQDINIIKKEDMKCKFKMSHLEEIICLKLVVLMMFIDMRRHAQRRGSPIVEYGGAILQVLTKLAQARKMFHLEVGMIVFIKLKWNAQGKGMLR